MTQASLKQKSISKYLTWTLCPAKVQIAKIKITQLKVIEDGCIWKGIEYHLWMLAESVSYQVLNGVRDGAVKRKCSMEK